MTADNFLATSYSTLTHYPLLALGAAIVLTVFLWKKPWEFLKLIVMATLLFGGLYTAMQLGESAQFGANSKHTTATKSEEIISNNSR